MHSETVASKRRRTLPFNWTLHHIPGLPLGPCRLVTESRWWWRSPPQLQPRVASIPIAQIDRPRDIRLFHQFDAPFTPPPNTLVAVIWKWRCRNKREKGYPTFRKRNEAVVVAIAKNWHMKGDMQVEWYHNPKFACSYTHMEDRNNSWSYQTTWPGEPGKPVSKWNSNLFVNIREEDFKLKEVKPGLLMRWEERDVMCREEQFQVT